MEDGRVGGADDGDGDPMWFLAAGLLAGGAIAAISWLTFGRCILKQRKGERLQ